MSWHNRKEHGCPYCEKSFKKPRQLKSHVKDAHPNEKKYFIEKVTTGQNNEQ